MKTPLVLLAGLLASTDPNQLDPTRVHTFTIDEPLLPSRVKAPRLREHLSVAWRQRVPAAIAHPPAVSPDGALLVAHTRQSIAKYDTEGRLLWTAWLGTSPAATSPIPFADGSLLVLSEDGEALAFSARGTRLWSLQLPLGPLPRPPLVGAERDGSVLVAEGRTLTRLDQSRVTLLIELDQELAALLGAPGAPVAVGNAGAVWELLPSGNFRHRGELGGKVSGAARADETRLLAVVDRERLVELDLAEGLVSVLFRDPTLTLGAFALTPEGEIRILAAGGSGPPGKGGGSSEFLITLARDGKELARREIPSAFNKGEFALDAAGSALMTRAGSHALQIAPDGSSESIAGTACADPFRPILLAERAAVLACRSGVLVGLR